MPFGSTELLKEYQEEISDLRMQVHHKTDLAGYWEMKYKEKCCQLSDATLKTTITEDEEDEIYTMFSICDNCGCSRIMKGFKYCPECGREIEV